MWPAMTRPALLYSCFSRGLIAGSEIDDNLVENDFVQHPDARLSLQQLGERLGQGAVALHQLNHPFSSQCLEQGIDRHAAGPARKLRHEG